MHVLRHGGMMSEDDLIRETSRVLGFNRLGKRIRLRIGNEVSEMLSGRQLVRTGDRIDLADRDGGAAGLIGLT